MHSTLCGIVRNADARKHGHTHSDLYIGTYALEFKYTNLLTLDQCNDKTDTETLEYNYKFTHTKISFYHLHFIGEYRIVYINFLGKFGS